MGYISRKERPKQRTPPGIKQKKKKEKKKEKVMQGDPSQMMLSCQIVY